MFAHMHTREAVPERTLQFVAAGSGKYGSDRVSRWRPREMSPAPPLAVSFAIVLVLAGCDLKNPLIF